MDDSEIVELYFNRSDKAISETEKKYGAYCSRIAYNILSNLQDSEECVNDTWLGAWNSIPPHRPQTLKTFLGKITRRLSLMKLRSQNRLKRGSGSVEIALEELGDCVGSADSVEADFEEKELTAAINAFLSSLGETERDVFVCRYWYFAPIAGISKGFGFSESKTKSMLFRTRNKLRAYLQEEGYI